MPCLPKSQAVRTINHADVIYDLSRWGWPEAALYHGRDGLVPEALGPFEEPAELVVGVLPDGNDGGAGGEGTCLEPPASVQASALALIPIRLGRQR